MSHPQPFHKTSLLNPQTDHTLPSLAIELIRQLNYPIPPPRAYSPTGLTSSAADGNLLGGLLLGTGMALSLSCPGMALPQLALRIPAAPAIIAGSIAGGVVWSAALRPWIEQRRQQRRGRSSPRVTTIPQALGGMDRTTAFWLFELAIAAAVVAVRNVGARSWWAWPPAGPTAWSPLDPVLGGLLIGNAQLASLLLRGSLLGVSSCYEQLGDWVVYVFAKGSGGGGERRRGSSRPGTAALLFAVAVVGGAWALRARRPELAPVVVSGQSEIGTVRALVGGFLMAVGSRLAGGCASGHGISGLALMSMSSVVTMFATFAAAIGVSKYAL